MAATDQVPYLLAVGLAGRRVVIIGGGGVAARRVPGLADAGAVVTVVTPELTPALYDLAEAGRLTWLERRYKPGDCAGFKANVPNGHHLINKSNRDALYLEIGSRAPSERAHYPDVDLFFERDEKQVRILHKSGEPY